MQNTETNTTDVTALDAADIPRHIAATKARLRATAPDLAQRFTELDTDLRAEIDELASITAAGDSPIPQLAYADLAANAVPAATRALIQKRGCAIIRGVFSRPTAEAWNTELGDYIEKNDYATAERQKRGMDNYFGDLADGQPQIFGIYWSPPQVQARQSEQMATTRQWLNSLWTLAPDPAPPQNDIHPNRDCTYADRIRRRAPGDATLGLSPHVDGGSVERWLDPGYRRVYRHIFSGDWRRYNPFEMTHRITAREIPSPAVCRAFRTYQGWTALTPQGAGDGTLQLVPSARAMAWILLRALQSDIAEDDLCAAAPGRALPVSPAHHAPLLRGLASIPHMQPGDTVWWHPDVIHAVENQNTGAGYSNVMYIGAAPDCPKNRAFLQEQLPCFLAGRSSPDFAAEDYELHYPNRATEAMLTPLGRRQIGLDAWT